MKELKPKKRSGKHKTVCQKLDFNRAISAGGGSIDIGFWEHNQVSPHPYSLNRAGTVQCLSFFFNWLVFCLPSLVLGASSRDTVGITFWARAGELNSKGGRLDFCVIKVAVESSCH